MNMSFSEYESRAGDTAIYKQSCFEFAAKSDTQQNSGMLRLAYVALGLAGEAGEFSNKVKKLIRDSPPRVVALDKTYLAGELGDVLWYIRSACEEIGVPMEKVATLNLAKLKDRQQRGVLGGSGDSR